ncbi:hypothetical protein EMCRGX_G023448 [Ephydatia muelleri]
MYTRFVKAYSRGDFTARNSRYGALNKQTVIVVAPLICIVAMASEITNHLCGAANKYCHICETLQLYVPKELEKSILQQIAEINSQHTEAAKATLRTQFGLNEAYNIFLDP